LALSFFIVVFIPLRQLFIIMKLLLENWREFVELNEAINPITIEKIEAALVQAGGESYIVGGAVRDELMPDTPPSKDVDFLVRGLSLSDIVSVLSPLGKVKEVGQAFGVVTATIDGEEFDFAIPRTSETKTGEKHTEFEVTTDPHASIESDLGRRDFTINALAKDSEGNIVDLFGGQEDLRNKVIRTVGDPNDRFKEDPLRMLRAIQFATRFDFSIDAETLEAIRKNVSDVATVAGERVLMEFEKAWTKGSDNTDKLVSLLGDTGIGEVMFGKDFDPRPVKVSGNAEEKILGNAMAFFMHGGDYTKIKPSKEVVKNIKLARQSISGQEVYEYGGKSRSELSLLAEVLGQIGYKEESEKVLNALLLPLNPVELEISGAEIVNLGLKGPIVGKMQLRLLQAVHAGEVENENDDLLDYLRILVDNNEAPI